MRTLIEQILSFLVAGALGGLGVVIRYTNKIRNDEAVKLKWFLSEMATGILLAGSSYTLLPEGGFKVPVAVFIGYFSHTVLDLLDKKMPAILEEKLDEFVRRKAEKLIENSIKDKE